MHPPRKHHYLPEWYLSRWQRPWNGQDVIWEFGRVGPKQNLQARYRHPAATGYEKDLYTIPDRPPLEAAEIETKLLQVIDDRGSKALLLAENNEAAGPEDKAGLIQFMLSMLHRSPERISYLEKRLADDLADHPLFKDEDPATYRAGALITFAQLVQSEQMIGRLMEMSIFVINLSDLSHDLLTSDCPLMVSNGIAQKESFLMLPTGPRTIVMLTEDKDIPKYIAGHGGKVISKAINDAVVVQARKLVFGPDKRQARFIDNRLNRGSRQIDPVMGLVKWKL